MPPKGGSARRFAQSLEKKDAGGGAQASSTPKAPSPPRAKGGARQRFLASSAASASLDHGGDPRPAASVSRKRGREEHPVLPPAAEGDDRIEAKRETPKSDTPFTDDMKNDWGKGHISSVRVLQYARSAQQQGAHSLDQMSKAATGGQHPQNAQRDLIRIF